MSLSYIIFQSVLIGYFGVETVKRIVISRMSMRQRESYADRLLLAANVAQAAILFVGVVILLFWLTGAY